jgi:hypothetical protein
LSLPRRGIADERRVRRVMQTAGIADPSVAPSDARPVANDDGNRWPTEEGEKGDIAPLNEDCLISVRVRYLWPT